jgi:3-hydroxyacyl-CoA dehydrogenase/enoyl-CoA hydratase/3-hydroxybutyryl-CoA epimerase
MVSSKMSNEAVGTIRRSDTNGVAVLTLDNPEASLNVIDERVFDDLRESLREIDGDDSIRAVVLTSGKRGSFGAGADVTWLPELAVRPDAHGFLAAVHDLMYSIVDSPRPLVTAINGAAFGGALELALSGDAIVASPTATLGLPEITLGLIPGGAGTQLLRRWVSTDRALDILLTGKPLSATAALEAGLVTAIVPEDQLMDAAVELALTLVTSPLERPIESREDALAAVSARTAPSGAASRIL